jgi:hypothetical protein
MPAPITTLRASLAAALANTNVWNTYAYPPPTITANSVIVSPADPYITPTNNDYANISPMASFRIICNVPLYDNQGNLQGIESTNDRHHYLNTNRVELSMSLTDEDIAFLIKIGQITEAPKKETKTPTPTTQKSEE